MQGDRKAKYVFGKVVNLAFAQAIGFEPHIGVLLPCNVVVRVEGATTLVEILDPHAVLQLVGRSEIAQVAGEVRSRLKRVLAAL